MHNFIATIGIEVHTALNTKTKMFSAAKNQHNDLVNTNINEIDLALPGTLPSVNEAAVKKAIHLATALKMEIDPFLTFDRKNYFYHDLPKGFQITQFFHPIGKNGFIEIENQKQIRIERIHLEEDTAKQQIVDNRLCLDYNRAGIPLIEIVSKADMHTANEAVSYLKNLKRILTFIEASDAKMEDGSLRADVNISIAPIGAKQLGNKVEIKNINSFNNVAKSIEYEIKRQTQILLKNEVVEQQTRRWDDETQSTIFMRSKGNEVNYRYFAEPNILPIILSNEYLEDTIKQINLLPEQVKENFKTIGVAEDIINILIDNYDLYKLFIKINQQVNQTNLVITWVVIELMSYLNRDKLSINQIDQKVIDHLVTMLKLINDQKINNKQAKTVFEKIYQTKKDPLLIIEELGFKQITDEKTIKEILLKHINANNKMLEQYDERPERVEKFFIGMLMKDTKGQANPNIAIKVFKEMIKK